MSLDASDWVWEYSRSKGVARLVALAIADKAPGPDCKAFASMSMLQKAANAGRPAVVAAVRDLVESGELEVVEGEFGPYGAAVYRLPKALGYIRGAAGSVRKQNRSTGAHSTPTGSVSEPIGDPEGAEIGFPSEPIQKEIGSVSEPIDHREPSGIGSETEPIDETKSVRSPNRAVRFTTPIGSVSEPQNIEQLQIQTTTNTSLPDPASETKPAPPRRRSAAKPDPAARFPEFYSAYPRKVAPAKAEAAWIKAIKDGADSQLIIDVARIYAMERKGQDPTFTKHPATWLNGKCWLDEPDPAYQPPTGARPGDYSAWRNPTDPNAYDGDL